MYQVAWTRRLITVTSATSTAQAIVLAIFMAGLGLGSLLGGRIAPRLTRPRLGYSFAEVAAALLALLALPLVTASQTLRSFGGVWFQLVSVSLYLLLPATLLGASLPMLIEHSLRSDETSLKLRGRWVSLLYGLNTIGAAVGCLVAGFYTVEHRGLFGTVTIGALLAVGAAALAALTRAAPSGAHEAKTEAPAQTGLLISAALAGFVGLGAEVLWTRWLQMIIPTTVYAFSQVLFAVLIGIALGAFIVGASASAIAKAEEPRARSLRLCGLFSCLVAVLLGVIPLAVIAVADDSALQKALAAGRSLKATLMLMALLVPASALIAAILPLLVMTSRATKGSSAFATLYGANTAGSVVGSLMTGFVFIPMLGSKGAQLLLMLITIALAAMLLRRKLLIPIVALLCCLLLHFSHGGPLQIYAQRIEKDDVILGFKEGKSSSVMVTQNPRTGFRRLWINSIWVAGTGGPHRAFGHLPGLFVEAPKNALGIALGTGQTFAAVFKHNIERLDCVEIDQSVIELSRRWFKSANDGLLDRPKVHVHNDDGRAFLRATASRYDLIVLEPLQAWTAGTTNLYTKEFYEEAKRKMTPGGVLTQWIPFYGQAEAETRAMVKTGLEVFQHGTLWLTLQDGVLLLSDTPFSLDPKTLQSRIDSRQLSLELEQFPAGSSEDLLSFLLLGPKSVRAWSQDADVIEDDRPFLEFRAAGKIGAGVKFQPILKSVRQHMAPLSETVTSTSARLMLTDRVRRAMVDLKLMPKGNRKGRVELLEQLLPEANQSMLWRSRYRNAVLRYARSRRDLNESKAILERAAQRAPGIPRIERALQRLRNAPPQ